MLGGLEELDAIARRILDECLSATAPDDDVVATVGHRLAGTAAAGDAEQKAQVEANRRFHVVGDVTHTHNGYVRGCCAINSTRSHALRMPMRRKRSIATATVSSPNLRSSQSSTAAASTVR